MNTAIEPTRAASWWVVLSTILVLLLILNLPSHPLAFGIGSFVRLPLELPAVLVLLAAWRGRVSMLLRLVIVVMVLALALMRLLDVGSYLAFDRRFSPLVEWHLLSDGWNLASQSIGRVEAGLALGVACLCLLVLLILLYRGLGSVQSLPRRARHGVLFGSLVVLLAGLVVHEQQADAGGSGGQTVNGAPVGTTLHAEVLPEFSRRVRDMRRSIVDLRRFERALAQDPVPTDSSTLFGALDGRDVVVLFIESYGRGFIDGERFREAARDRLAGTESVLDTAGLGVRSGWLESPVRGGRSWLAHATFASGLRVDSQARFDRLIASDWRSLNRLFASAGWRTAGLMPAIQLDWPEGGWYGFDTMLDAQALDYQGLNFSWVTMPDQFTLQAFEERVRPSEESPVMAEIAMISSHAPWTPLPELLPWSRIGDGSVFDGSHRSGPDPADLWKDRTLVREQFARSLDYVLELLGDYIARFGDDALFIVLGDHQPAAIVNGWGDTADVPIHLISADRELLQRVPEHGFTSGMLPPEGGSSLPMEAMRENLVRWFSS